MRPVLTKADFAARYIQGEFGNRAPSWSTLEEYLAADYRGLVHIRNKIVGGPTWYDIPHDRVEETYRELVTPLGRTNPVDPDTLYFSGMSPHRFNLLQGEVCRGDWNYNPVDIYLRYSTTVGINMRQAYAEGMQVATGILALERLRYVMCANSWEWLQYLFDAYPGHIIEFSTFSVDWGTLPRHNTIVWECRYGY